MDSDPPRQIPGVDGLSSVSGVSIERDGFARLYQQELPYVVNTARRLGAPSSDLQDIAQKVFVEVWRRRDSYDATRAIRPWLFGFAFRVVATHRRDPWRRRAVHQEFEGADESVSSGEERADTARNRALVMQCLDELEIDRKVVFIMMDIDEMSAPDVASTLEIPLGTVYGRLRLARQDFAASMKRLRLKRGER
jgi:RNA polymerase sigma-70 factor, ECF subfamily